MRIYILGVTEGIAVGMNIAAGKTKAGRPCIPDDLSGDALERAVKTGLSEDLTQTPKDRDLDASAFIATVMGAKFPCAKPRL